MIVVISKPKIKLPQTPENNDPQLIQNLADNGL